MFRPDESLHREVISRWVAVTVIMSISAIIVKLA